MTMDLSHFEAWWKATCLGSLGIHIVGIFDEDIVVTILFEVATELLIAVFGRSKIELAAAAVAPIVPHICTASRAGMGLVSSLAVSPRA